jgi:two-component system chemotaxis response regulator CheB
VLKFSPDGAVDPAALRREIVAKVEAAARIRVIRSLRPRSAAAPLGARAAAVAGPAARRDGTARNGGAPVPPREAAPRPAAEAPPPAVVVLGASTGGPAALRQLLAELPPSLPAAVVVVQHLPAAFTEVLTAQLDRQVALEVRQARDGDRLRPGTVWIAPGGSHLLLGADSTVELRPGPDISGHCPSVDVTMQSAALAYGRRAWGVLLTGMGSDGAAGLSAIRLRGGRTFAQDAASCVVSGMPQRAVERGAVEEEAPPWEIGARLAAELTSPWRRQAC